MKIFGKDAWTDAVEIHKRIAYVPGDVNLWPNLTGGEVIDLFVKLRGTNQKVDVKSSLKNLTLIQQKNAVLIQKGIDKRLR